ncbi:MAG: hypothetical protein AB7F43_13460 [Bacteriovoracia bacterium]
MSFVYFISKFSTELLIIELFFISLISSFYFGLLVFKKKKYGSGIKDVPDTVIRAYIGQLINQAENFKNALFGSDFKGLPSDPALFSIPNSNPTNLVMGSAPGVSGAAADPQVKAQLSASLAKQSELEAIVAKLTAEKASLEEKVKTAGSAPASGGGGADPKALQEAQEKINKLQAMLSEYEVIEDDLANLKRYQQENQALRQQLGKTADEPITTQTAAPAAPTPPPAAPEPTPAPTPDAQAASEPAVQEPTTPAAAPEASATTPEQGASAFDAVVDNVEGQIAAPASPTEGNAFDAAVAASETPVPAAQPTPEAPAAPAPAAATPAPASNATPAATPPAEGAAPTGEKSDEDLLSEFEKMLNG